MKARNGQGKGVWKMVSVIILNIATFVLAIYLSLYGKNQRLKRSVWAIAIILTAGNSYVKYQELHEETLYFDILAPNISSKEAYEEVRDTFAAQVANYSLVDVIGSYYICMKKPDTFYHRFPEWLLVFRSDNDPSRLIEFRVFDTRIPPIPHIKDLDLKQLLTHNTDPRIRGGEVVSFITLRVSPEYLGIYLPRSDDERTSSHTGSYILSVIDHSGEVVG